MKGGRGGAGTWHSSARFLGTSTRQRGELNTSRACHFENLESGASASFAGREIGFESKRPSDSSKPLPLADFATTMFLYGDSVNAPLSNRR